MRVIRRTEYNKLINSQYSITTKLILLCHYYLNNYKNQIIEGFDLNTKFVMANFLHPAHKRSEINQWGKSFAVSFSHHQSVSYFQSLARLIC